MSSNSDSLIKNSLRHLGGALLQVIFCALIAGIAGEILGIITASAVKHPPAQEMNGLLFGWVFSWISMGATIGVALGFFFLVALVFAHAIRQSKISMQLRSR